MILSKKTVLILMSAITAMIAVCLVILLIYNSLSGKSSPTDNTPSDSGSSSVILEKTADYGKEYIDKIIFVGDSTTYSLKYYAMLSGGKNTKQVWTPASGTVTLDANIAKTRIVYPDTGEEISIPEAARRKKPEYMIITLGINGVSFLEKENFIKYYTKLIDAVAESSPDTKIILQSIFPVTAEYSSSQSSITNSKVDTANTWVKKIAESCGVKYLDTQSALKGNNGALPSRLSNDNEIHLNEEGLNIELNYIRTHGYVD